MFARGARQFNVGHGVTDTKGLLLFLLGGKHNAVVKLAGIVPVGVDLSKLVADLFVEGQIIVNIEAFDDKKVD